MTIAEPHAADEPRPRKPRSRHRFEQKRELVLDVAADLINERGIKGMTLLDVARAVGVKTTSISYYFRRKEQLAAAVFEKTLARLEDLVADAGTAATPQARVERLLALAVSLHADIIRGHARPLASLSDVRTLEAPFRTPLERHFQEIFRQVRAFFGPPRDERHKALLTARTHMLFEVIFWMRVWIAEYALADFPRVQRRLVELLSNGIARPGAPWLPRTIDHVDPEELTFADTGQANFLRAATRLINEAGYRGASVERIVAELSVTKGCFYHHLETKDDLVLECFRQSYRQVSRVQSLAEQAGGDHWQRMSSAIATLLDIQFEAERPLLRTTALQALPTALRAEMVKRSNRLALRFAGMLVDGVSDGSMQAVDPMIACQLIVSTLNTAYDLRKWASRLPRQQAIAFYASTLVDGLFNDRVLAQPSTAPVVAG
jgi:AcrR family transcriptional regulator